MILHLLRTCLHYRRRAIRAETSVLTLTDENLRLREALAEERAARIEADWQAFRCGVTRAVRS